MTDKATIQPKSKPEKTTISISGETSERLEIYCRANGILRKEFVSLALDYFERTGFDLQSNALDYSPLEKIIRELKEVKTTMQTNNEGTEAVRQFLQVVREQTTKQLPAPELIAHAAEEKAKNKKGRLPGCDPKTLLCRSTRKKHTKNCAGYVTSKRQ